MPRATIESVKFLAEDQCESVRAVIYRLKDLWETHRRSDLDGAIKHPFYTLGVPSYIGAATHDKEANYYSKARNSNPIIKAELSWLYDRLAATLSGLLGKHVSYSQNLALPGFHIFPTQPDILYPGNGLHLDMQYKYIAWEQPQDIDFKNPVSFTVPISLPDEGGGLNVCDHPATKLMLLSEEERQSVLNQEIRHIPYSLGEMIVHHGLLWHEIAERRNTSSQMDRITFQGHGLLRNNIWQLYW